MGPLPQDPRPHTRRRVRAGRRQPAGAGPGGKVSVDSPELRTGPHDPRPRCRAQELDFQLRLETAPSYGPVHTTRGRGAVRKNSTSS